MIEADRVRHPESATGLKIICVWHSVFLNEILTDKLSSKQWAQV